MKTFIMIIAFLFSSTAFACLDLTGTYAYSDNHGNSFTKVISKRVESGVTIYTIDGADYIADGEEHSLDDDDHTENYLYTLTCQTDGYVLEDSFDEIEDETLVANIERNVVATVDSETGDISYLATGTVTYPNNSTEPLSGTGTAIKQP